jgi:amino acid permease
MFAKGSWWYGGLYQSQKLEDHLTRVFIVFSSPCVCIAACLLTHNHNSRINCRSYNSSLTDLTARYGGMLWMLLVLITVSQ